MQVEVDDRIGELQVVTLGQDVGGDEDLRRRSSSSAFVSRTATSAGSNQEVTATRCSAGDTAVDDRGSKPGCLQPPMDVASGVPELSEQEQAPCRQSRRARAGRSQVSARGRRLVPEPCRRPLRSAVRRGGLGVARDRVRWLRGSARSRIDRRLPVHACPLVPHARRLRVLCAVFRLFRLIAIGAQGLRQVRACGHEDRPGDRAHRGSRASASPNRRLHCLYTIEVCDESPRETTGIERVGRWRIEQQATLVEIRGQCPPRRFGFRLRRGARASSRLRPFADGNAPGRTEPARVRAG